VLADVEAYKAQGRWPRAKADTLAAVSGVFDGRIPAPRAATCSRKRRATSWRCCRRPRRGASTNPSQRPRHADGIARTSRNAQVWHRGLANVADHPVI
jgi:hypothetical protein